MAEYQRDSLARSSYSAAENHNTRPVRREQVSPGALPRRQVVPKTSRREQVRMNLGYMVFLLAATAMTGYILFQYVSLRSDITQSLKTIAQMESTLYNLQIENNEEYSRIQSSIDLDEIRRIAIEELGMHYAQEGQIVYYTAQVKDYVRQYASIP